METNFENIDWFSKYLIISFVYFMFMNALLIWEKQIYCSKIIFRRLNVKKKNFQKYLLVFKLLSKNIKIKIFICDIYVAVSILEIRNICSKIIKYLLKIQKEISEFFIGFQNIKKKKLLHFFCQIFGGNFGIFKDTTKLQIRKFGDYCPFIGNPEQIFKIFIGFKNIFKKLGNYVNFKDTKIL